MEDKEPTIAASSAFGLGTFAVIFSLCCVGPFMITLLGVSGAIFIASFEPYRIYIIAVAAACWPSASGGYTERPIIVRRVPAKYAAGKRRKSCYGCLLRWWLHPTSWTTFSGWLLVRYK